MNDEEATRLNKEERDLKLKQYEIFSARKLHYGNLFWSATGLFFAVSALLVNVLKGVDASTAKYILAGAAVVTLYTLIFSIRLTDIESKYEDLLEQIETDLLLLRAPKSKTFGTRLLTGILLSAGLTVMILGAIFIQ